MLFNPFIASPYPWIFLASIFTGYSISRLTRSVKKARNPEKAKNRKWVLIYLSLSIAFILGICAVFIPGPEKILDAGLFTFFLVASVIFFLAFRFKKILGIPFLFIFALFIIAVILFIQALVAFTGETEIAKVKVIYIKEEHIKYELIPSQGESMLIEMAGVNFAPEVRLIIFDDFLVFFGAKSWYRFQAMLHPVPAKSSESGTYLSRYPLKTAQGLPELIYNFVVYNEVLFPGIKAKQLQITYPEPVRELTTYSIRVQNDGGVQIVKIN